MSFLSKTIPLCFHISLWKLGLEDSENVCGDFWWCSRVNIIHKCRRECLIYLVCFLPLPLFLSFYFYFSVFLAFPIVVISVYSIRLEYGCVVVDTCCVWSVNRCCRVLIRRYSWCHQTQSSDWISGDKRWKGRPRFPEKKNNVKTWFLIAHPYSFLKEEEEERKKRLLELLSVCTQHHSRLILWMWKPPWPVLYVLFHGDILSQLQMFEKKLDFCQILHSSSAYTDFCCSSSWKVTFLNWSRLERSKCICLSLGGPWKLKELLFCKLHVIIKNPVRTVLSYMSL